MRLKTIGILATVWMMTLASAAMAADVAKIGVFDFDRFLKSSEAGKAAKVEVAAQAKKMEAELAAKKGEIATLRDKLMREAMVMTDEMRSQKEREIQIKTLDLKSMEKRFSKAFNQHQGKLMADIQKEVKELLRQIGKKGNYLLILENVGVVYAPDRVDLTDQLIQEHNKKFGKKS